MKIALPVKDDYQIARNLEDCELYQIFTINDKNEPLFVETTDIPKGFDFKTKMAKDLENEGVKVLLVRDIRTDTINILATHGIEVVRSSEGHATELVKHFLTGMKKNGEILQL